MEVLIQSRFLAGRKVLSATYTSLEGEVSLSLEMSSFTLDEQLTLMKANGFNPIMILE